VPPARRRPARRRPAWRRPARRASEQARLAAGCAGARAARYRAARLLCSTRQAETRASREGSDCKTWGRQVGRKVKRRAPCDAAQTARVHPRLTQLPASAWRCNAGACKVLLSHQAVSTLLCPGTDGGRPKRGDKCGGVLATFASRTTPQVSSPAPTRMITSRV
jgi:hypothetical protein